MQDTNDIDGVFGELVEDKVVGESFDGVLANLGNFWVCKTAKSADARSFGDELEGGFGSIDKALAKPLLGESPASKLS
jgi:hypothetical protein